MIPRTAPSPDSSPVRRDQGTTPGSTGPNPANAELAPSASQRGLRRFVAIFGCIVLPVGLAWVAIGGSIGDRALFAVGIVALVFTASLLLAARFSGGWPAAVLATRVAIMTCVAIVAGVTAEPALGPALTMAALIPAVLAMAYVTRRRVGELMLLGAAVGIYSAISPAFWPWGSRFGMPLDLVLPATTLIAAYAIFHIFLWNASGQLVDSTTELGAAMAMSREVAQTLDPQLVGRIIARHIATSAGATDCALSTWDRENDRLVTFAYFPPERQTVLETTYDLARYPATRAVLMEGKVVAVDVADPGSDPDEVAYLREIGQATMVMMPLVVRGEAIGTVEFSSDRSGAFDDRGIELAGLLAREAAISLENARLYDQLHHQAFRDGLTGLANRVLFHDRVTHALDRLRGRSQHAAAVLFLDIDHFKLLNDRFGHSRGDEVLQAIAERVRASIRPGDTAARLGGDEFAILLEDVDGLNMAMRVAERLASGLSGPIDLGDGAPRIGASIGIAISGTGGSTADDLLRNADIAMYAAKAAGRGRIEVFRPEHLERAAQRSELGARLRGAADRGELHLVYQPIVELASADRAIVGLEALLRWQTPAHGLRMPVDFIALAEETGEIVPIGRWVIDQACRQARAWQLTHRLPRLRVNVNLSARQFADPELHNVVATALHTSGLAAACLTLEITESTLMQRTEETLDRVRGLRNLGVRLSIDDFGTGYSSLGYLQAFEVDELKIDRSFVSEVPLVGNPRVLSRAIVELGKALELEMVVEGVESLDQASWFAALGCQFAQGHLYSRPLDAGSVDAYLSTAGRKAARSASRSPRRDLRVVPEADSA